MGIAKYAEDISDRYFEGNSESIDYKHESSFIRVVRVIDDLKSAYENHYEDSEARRSHWEDQLHIIDEIYEVLTNVSLLSDDNLNRWEQLQHIEKGLQNIFAKYGKYGPLSQSIFSTFFRDSKKIFERINVVIDELRSIQRYREIQAEKNEILLQAIAKLDSFREKLNADILEIGQCAKRCRDTKKLWDDFREEFCIALVENNHRTPLQKLDRFRLNQDQENQVVMDYDGHRRIQGASGCGKTVILIHRALRLARENPDHKIWVFTINRSLAEHLTSMMQTIHGNIPANIRIAAFYDFMKNCISLFTNTNHLRLVDGNERIGGDPELFGSSWNLFYFRASQNPAVNIFARPDVQKLINFINGWGGQRIDACQYLRQEIIYIQSAFRKKNREHYLDRQFERSSRSIPLDTTQRKICLEILEVWEDQWSLPYGLCDIDGMTTFMTKYLDSEDSRKKIIEEFNADHILIDEFQDFSTLEMTILKDLFASDEKKKNLFFMVGDLNQKVFSKHHHRGQAGFDFRADVPVKIPWKSRLSLKKRHSSPKSAPSTEFLCGIDTKVVICYIGTQISQFDP